jgi:hypothetical protein
MNVKSETLSGEISQNNCVVDIAARFHARVQALLHAFLQVQSFMQTSARKMF